MMMLGTRDWGLMGRFAERYLQKTPTTLFHAEIYLGASFWSARAPDSSHSCFETHMSSLSAIYVR